MSKEEPPKIGEHESEVVLKETLVGGKHTDTSTPQEKAEDCQTEDCNLDEEKIGADVYEEKEKTSKDVDYKARTLFRSLPETIKRRVNALRALQLKIIDNNAKFCEIAFKLEKKLEKIRSDLFEKRFKIISGEYEPTDEECDYNSSDEATKIKLDLGYPAYNENVKGIPDFWLIAFKNSSILEQIFQDHDEPILSHLQDIKLKFHESPYGYTLEFYFSENEYFTNHVLTKYFELSFEPDKDHPFDFDGGLPISCKGCEINWKEGQNITLKTKEKFEDERNTKPASKTAFGSSFFNFFNPLTIDASDSDSDDKAILYEHFDLGNVFKDLIIPKAALYYTGEEFDDEDDLYEDLELEEELSNNDDEVVSVDDDEKEEKNENKEEKDENKEEKDENNEVRSTDLEIEK